MQIMLQERKIRSQWASRLTFILAVTGSAVGLGNIWKFPYVAGESGGGAFILVYIIAILLVLPVMASEILLGRRGQRNPISTMGRLSRDFGLSQGWKAIGVFGVLAGFLILSYYSVIGGWIIAYIFRAGAGIFDHATTDGVNNIYLALVGDTEKLLAWHTLFMLLTAGIVAYGVKSGIERMISYVMPIFFGLLLMLFIYVAFDSAFMESIRFMFTFNFDKITGEILIAALGQAFYSLSLGLGAIMVYGSYLSTQEKIVHSASIIVIVDTLVAILAGMIVFSLVFEYGLDPAQGVGLIFKTLTLVFGRMPAGEFFGAIFFILLFLAAWTSAISLLEPAVSWMCEELNFTRGTASWISGFIVWLLGIGTIFSFTDEASWSIAGISLFSAIDYLTANIMLPLGGVLMVIFVGWRLPIFVFREELDISSPGMYQLWRIMLRYVTPTAILVILGNTIYSALIQYI